MYHEWALIHRFWGAGWGGEWGESTNTGIQSALASLTVTCHSKVIRTSCRVYECVSLNNQLNLKLRFIPNLHLCTE